MRNVIKYVLIGGEIRSRDGDRHRISPIDLVRCYRLKKEECLFFTHSSASDSMMLKRAMGQGLFILYPRPNGDYEEFLKRLTSGRCIAMEDPSMRSPCMCQSCRMDRLIDP